MPKADDSSEALDILFAQIKAHFETYVGEYLAWVRQLAVMAERLRFEVHAYKNLLPGSTLLHQVKNDGIGLANGLREEAAANLHRVKDHDLLNRENVHHHDIYARWQILSANARVCATIDGETVEIIGRLVLV